MDKSLEKNKRKETKRYARRSAKMSEKAESINADEGMEAAQRFLRKKAKKFASKETPSERKAAEARGAETKSERIAAEVESGKRKIGGKKKKKKFGTGNHPRNK
tara:strand:+ start:615 stop:926 length:312 start_codon:yes stop_codon:yes gene_type:complete